MSKNRKILVIYKFLDYSDNELKTKSLKNLVRNQVYEKFWLKTEILGKMGYKLGLLKIWVINRGKQPTDEIKGI